MCLDTLLVLYCDALEVVFIFQPLSSTFLPLTADTELSTLNISEVADYLFMCVLFRSSFSAIISSGYCVRMPFYFSSSNLGLRMLYIICSCPSFWRLFSLRFKLLFAEHRNILLLLMLNWSHLLFSRLILLPAVSYIAFLLDASFSDRYSRFVLDLLRSLSYLSDFPVFSSRRRISSPLVLPR